LQKKEAAKATSVRGEKTTVRGLTEKMNTSILGKYRAKEGIWKTKQQSNPLTPF
jgi:hypothetical protein